MLYSEILHEDAEDIGYFLDKALDVMINGHHGESCWITAHGDPETIPMFGEHEDLAYQLFGPKGNHDDDADEQEIRRRYGHLFAGWPSKYITYTDVAMKHGWVRLLFAPHRKTLFINCIQGAVSPAAKAVMRDLIGAIDPVVQTYVIEHSSGLHTPQNNFTVTDGRKALALVV